jgi:hypothetical protein
MERGGRRLWRPHVKRARTHTPTVWEGTYVAAKELEEHRGVGQLVVDLALGGFEHRRRLGRGSGSDAHACTQNLRAHVFAAACGYMHRGHRRFLPKSGTQQPQFTTVCSDIHGVDGEATSRPCLEESGDNSLEATNGLINPHITLRQRKK